MAIIIFGADLIRGGVIGAFGALGFLVRGATRGSRAWQFVNGKYMFHGGEQIILILVLGQRGSNADQHLLESNENQWKFMESLETQSISIENP